MAEHVRVAVIGGAVAGLASMQPLIDEGHEVVAFERDEDVLGTWATVYDSVLLLSAKSIMSFKGYPMPDDVPVYPSGEDYRAYIRDYAKRSRIKETDPLQHRRGDSNTGRLRPRRLEPSTLRWGSGHFDAVVVATGHLRVPVVPNVPGTFDGVQLHTSQYRNPGDFGQGAVVVVGAGNSLRYGDRRDQLRADGVHGGSTPTWFIPTSLWAARVAIWPSSAGRRGTSPPTSTASSCSPRTASLADYGFPQPDVFDWDWNPPTISTLIPLLGAAGQGEGEAVDRAGGWTDRPLRRWQARVSMRARSGHWISDET